MASPMHHADYEIMRACGYIKDDRYLASIFGVTIHRVRRMREKYMEEEEHAGRAMRAYNRLSYTDPSVSYDKYVADMEAGSYKLLSAIHRLLVERERRNV